MRRMIVSGVDSPIPGAGWPAILAAALLVFALGGLLVLWALPSCGAS